MSKAVVIPKKKKVTVKKAIVKKADAKKSPAEVRGTRNFSP